MSFATYASQFLTRPQPGSSSTNPSSSRSGTQPLFFSFTTDDASVQIDDGDDPHFRKYDSAELQGAGEDEDDPYLRLDDEDGQAEYARDRDGYQDEYGRNASPELDGDEEGAGVGWLAHQRSPSPPYIPSPPQVPRTISPDPRNYSSPVPPPQSLSLALSESLLPRMGPEVHAFNLPAPHSHSPRGRRRPQPNARAAAAFLFIYTLLCVLALLSLFLHSQAERPPPALLHTIPLLTFLTILSAILSYTHLALLRAFLRPVLLVSALAPPLALFLSAILAFAGSFSSGAGWGLRLFALVPLALALLSVRRLPAELHRAARSPALLALATRILFFRAPLLLLLSPLLLLAGLFLSLPLLTLLVRLPLSHAWYTQLASGLVAFFTLHVFFVARAVQRSVVAAGVGAWYFSYVPPTPPSGGWNTGSPVLDAQILTLHAAMHRPPGPPILSALAALVLALFSLLQLVLLYLPLALPYRFIALFADLALGKVQALGERLGGGRYTGVYCGLTGAGFWDGVKGVREITTRERASPALPLPRAYTLALPFALVAYLRAAGDQDGMSYADQQRAAIVAAILAGSVCAAVGVFCAGVVRDCADTLYVCHLIDRATGVGGEARDGERQEVWGAFDPSPVEGTPSDVEAGLNPPFNLPFNFGGLFGGGADAGAAGIQPGGEQGGRGEEPVYARLRRTSEEANRKMPPPPPPAPPMTRGRDVAVTPVGRGRDAAVTAPPTQHHPPPPPPRAPSPDSDVDSLDSRGGGESSGMFPGSGFF
ncbi:hypothetical protein DFH09DRAFT_1410560 [Mycena vulgaris]|nr:hypothetical protein DFH09DRAFT_1410560 [Mycena vulgaris]